MVSAVASCAVKAAVLASAPYRSGRRRGAAAAARVPDVLSPFCWAVAAVCSEWRVAELSAVPLSWLVAPPAGVCSPGCR